MMKSMLLLGVITAISGCAHQHEEPAPVDGVCGAFSVINPSRSDTPGTKRQILAHNQVYRATCGSN